MACTKKAKHRAPVIQIFSILFLLSFLIGAPLYRIKHLPPEMAMVEAKNAAYSPTLSAKGYVFCDATLLCSSNKGPVHYFFEDGDTVAAGLPAAEVFADDTGGGKREKAEKLQQEIRRLETYSDGSSPWQTDYFTSYGDLMATIGDGNLKSFSGHAASLSVSLGQKEAESLRNTTGAASPYGDRLADLRRELEELTRYVGSPQMISAGTSGRFFTLTDGKDLLFDTRSAEVLTPSQLTAAIGATETIEGTVGRLITGNTWYFAFPLPQDTALFEQGGQYTLTFSDYGRSLQGTLHHKATDNTGCLLVFSFDQLPRWFDFPRCTEVTLSAAPTCGISVPESALCVVDGQLGVYILRDGVSTFRLVRPVYRQDGCCLSAPTTDASFLQEGDILPLTTHRLFEGKVLNTL